MALKVEMVTFDCTDVQALGIQGRAVGDALEKLRATVIERPELNRRDELIGILKAMPSV